MQVLNNEKLQYVSLTQANIDKQELKNFNSGHPKIDNFLHEGSLEYIESGKGVTYILVESDEYTNKSISRIYAFATISSCGLLQESNDKLDDKTNDNAQNCAINVPCAEIKYFAINNCFRGQENREGTLYSVQFFKMLLQDLYFMSMYTIGFSTIFLRANTNGRRLYSNCGFIDFNEYIIPFDENAIDCTPMGVAICELDCW